MKIIEEINSSKKIGKSQNLIQLLILKHSSKKRLAEET